MNETVSVVGPDWKQLSRVSSGSYLSGHLPAKNLSLELSRIEQGAPVVHGQHALHY